MFKDVRVVVLCCAGERQDYLAMRASEEFTLVGIVRVVPTNPHGDWRQRFGKYFSPAVLVEYLLARVLLPREERRGRVLEKQLFWSVGRPPAAPAQVPCLRVQDINGAEAIDFVGRSAADIVLVNGTNLIRKPMLQLRDGMTWGFLNLHTGLSPYSRGGNCNLFMLLEGKPEHVGITVHHIDLGIDRGDIVLSDQTPMLPTDNWEMIDARSFHHGIEQLLKGAKAVIGGWAPRVKQWESGKLFLKRTGYVYKPFYRVLLNRALRRGLIAKYLGQCSQRDAAVRLVRCTPP